MNTFILALLLVPFLLFGQEQEQPGPPEASIYEFDFRCLAPLEWTTSLIYARRGGATVDVFIKQTTQNYATGPLQGYQPETIEYMLKIISSVFSADNVNTEEDMLVVFREVESLCITYMDREEKSVVN